MQAVITYAKQQYISPPHKYILLPDKYISPSDNYISQLCTHIEIFIRLDSSVCSKQCNSEKMKFYVRVHELSITSYPQFNYVHFEQDNKTTHT